MNKAFRRWRLLDTGVRGAAENIALDAVLLDSRAAGASPDTIRFLKFQPAAALVGYHQTVARELRASWCRQSGIEINRRITGGGAVYLDTSQICWEVIAGRGSLEAGATMASLTRTICDAAAAGLQLLGIPARFRPRNDIEVRGRKISGTGGAREGDAFLFQGTLLVDFDMEAMLQALRVPTEKLSRHDIDSARERVTCVRECLPALPADDEIKSAMARGFSNAFGIELLPGELTPAEEAQARERLRFHASDGWVYETAEDPEGDHLLTSVHLADGGTIRTTAAVDAGRRRLKSVLFTGDFFISPRRSVFDLESRLRYACTDEAEAIVGEFFQQEQPDAPGIAASDFISGLRMALMKLDYVREGLSPAEAEAVTIVGSGTEAGLKDILPAVGAVLLPYCAKLAACELRYNDGCDECGDCSVGLVFSSARSLGLSVVTVQSYDHLRKEFASLRAEGVTAYIGCCCQAFLVKRNEAFRTAGMTGIIVDIDDETCYELSREEDAYAGVFTGQTTLKTSLLDRLLGCVVDRGGEPSRVLATAEQPPGELS